MPIILPADLPAAATLRHEGVGVLERPDATRRTLQVALVNLMPDRPTTETQFARLLGRAGIDVALTLVIPDSHDPKTTSAAHIAAFYQRWSEIADRRFDGLIVTGAPVEHLAFADVHYWSELTQIFDWARTRLRGSYYVCWAAQAALKHFHGVGKHALPEKAFGVFPQRVTVSGAALMRGFGEMFPTPVSRHTEVRCAEIPWRHGLLPLAASPRSGLGLAEDRPNRALYMFNHLEYDADTLQKEYLRDRAAGLPITLPVGYFPGDDPGRAPINTWRRSGETLIGNWLADIAAPERIRPVAPPRPLSRPWLNINPVSGGAGGSVYG
jgi:homoserine O-succinyltransferase